MASAYPEHPAIMEQNGRKTTFYDLNRQCNRIVHGLYSLGIDRGDSIAILSDNNTTFIAITLAVLQSGMRLIPMNCDLSGEEISGLINGCNAKVLFVSERLSEKLLEISPFLNISHDRCFIIGSNCQGFPQFDDITSHQPASIPRNRWAGDFAFITSGTSGKPKCVVRPLKLADPDEKAALSTSFLAMFGIKPKDGNIFLVTLPLYYSSNLFTTVCSLHFGHTILLMDSCTPEAFIELINTHRVTFTLIAPLMFAGLLNLPDIVNGTEMTASLRCIIHSGLPCPIDAKQQLMDLLGPIIYEFYAGAEGGGTMITPQQWLLKPKSVGTPWPVSRVKVCDNSFRKLPPGEVGRIYLKTMNETFEYYKDQKGTEQAWQDGYYTLGDMGYLDEDGYLFLKDRESEVIRVEGEKIYPAEIEFVLNRHHAVRDAVVFGVPNGGTGEEVRAAVQLTDDLAPSLELVKNILSFCKRELGLKRAPSSINFISHLPRFPTGKLMKGSFRNRYEEKNISIDDPGR